MDLRRAWGEKALERFPAFGARRRRPSIGPTPPRASNYSLLRPRSYSSNACYHLSWGSRLYETVAPALSRPRWFWAQFISFDDSDPRRGHVASSQRQSCRSQCSLRPSVSCAVNEAFGEPIGPCDNALPSQLPLVRYMVFDLQNWQENWTEGG